MLKKIYTKIYTKFIRIYKIYLQKDRKTIALRNWKRIKGDNTLRLNYNLKNDSVVFDIGAYRGNWSQKIANIYNPHIYIFEPIEEFHTDINNNLKHFNNVFIYNFGFSNKNQNVFFHLANDASGIYNNSTEVESKAMCQLKDIYEFITENNIKNIDLLKINIEGGEYDLLERMIEKQITILCDNIQIQFHDGCDNWEDRLINIRNELKKTHILTYSYYLVWENWKKIE